MPPKLRAYVRIKHEVIDLFKQGEFTKDESRIIWFIIQQSWGWNAGESNWTHKSFTVQDIAKETKLDRARASKVLTVLIEQKVIKREKAKRGFYYSFDEHKERWENRIAGTKVRVKTTTRKSNKRSCQNYHTKRVKTTTQSVSKLPHSNSANPVTTRVFRIVNKDLKKYIKKKRSIVASKGVLGGNANDEHESDGGDSMAGLMRSLLAVQGINDATNDEIELLIALHGVEGYPFEPKKDLQFIRELKERFPDIDVHAVIIDWTVSKRYDDPLTKKSRPRSQINTWCRKRSEWKAEKENNNGGTSGSPKPSSGKVQSTYEWRGDLSGL